MPVSSKESLDIQATIKCRFTLKYVRDMIITYSHYYSRLAKTLLNVQRNLRPYWSISKTYCSQCVLLRSPKVPNIIPLFHFIKTNFRWITGFNKKVELFNSFSAKQCCLLSNDSKLHSRLHSFPDEHLSNIWKNNKNFRLIQVFY